MRILIYEEATLITLAFQFLNGGLGVAFRWPQSKANRQTDLILS